MKKLFFLYFLIFQSFAFACATCQLMTPNVLVNLDLKVQDKRLKTIHTEWVFSKKYLDEIVRQFDKNKNSILDANELDAVLKVKLNYLLPRELVTKIQYTYFDDEEPTDVKVKYQDFDIKVLNDSLIFSYDALVDIQIKEKMVLSFLFHDDESYFTFRASSLKLDAKDIYHETNLYLFTASVLFSNFPFKAQENIQLKKIPVNQKPIEQESEIFTLYKKWVNTSVDEIKSRFEAIKDEKNPSSYILLLVFAFIYGAIHALGPGHGKTLVGSYFLSNDKSYSRAFFVSLAIALVHTFSAFLFTLIVYYIVDIFLAKVLDDSIYYTTKLSALIIISIALYLMYKKYKAYKHIHKSNDILTCSCSSCNVDKNSTDLALIISAGIIPCTGTITIFIFTFSLGLYYGGFLSAFVMSLGMSTIIFASALVSVFVRKKTLNLENKNFTKYLEYTSLVVILLVGVLLLLA